MVCFFFFFKQKTAYEMRISDWSSDVCSSDLLPEQGQHIVRDLGQGGARRQVIFPDIDQDGARLRLGQQALVIMQHVGRGRAAEAAIDRADVGEAPANVPQAYAGTAQEQRGVGRVMIDRVPFNVDLALKALEGTEQLILIGARTPVA